MDKNTQREERALKANINISKIIKNINSKDNLVEEDFFNYRGGPTWLDRKVAELSYYCLVNVMPLLSVYEGYTPHKKFPFYTSDYKPHLGSVH